MSQQPEERVRNLSTTIQRCRKRENARQCEVVLLVPAVDNFEMHPTVLNGCSNLLGDIFEERGVHSRSAVGVYTLPLNACVEIEVIVEV